MKSLGFDGRVFLTDAEHDTYLRRPPVRYVTKNIPCDGGVSCVRPGGHRD